ncbi:DUF2262 domain-containing protein [Clostridium sp. YIM B02505]|uniref:DUF2262 domain-containing protein n=1 Tax=Clostridium yunnanense TaxID=2800325 RepID=A0ABS1ETP5_9CLOT|nr:DUF2262 domain-containing protein [Clostridium yunnanense]MBK1812742.1 DUF2262 domain-containing protein [Clostridium yunnanense]
MSRSSEINSFANRFEDEVFEIAAITGASGVGAGKAPKEELWGASINLVAWKKLDSNEDVVKIVTRLMWLADDEELKNWYEILKANMLVRLQVRMKRDYSMMLIKVLDSEYKDDELQDILTEAMKPVFYDDQLLGQFELDKRFNSFERSVSWAGEVAHLSFDLDEEKNMKSSVQTAQELVKNQDQWSQRIKNYAADELLELANDWLKDNDEAEIDEITREIFTETMGIDSICVHPDGEFEIFYFDGDMFWGHCIIVNGNINGEFSSAEIAG